MDELALNILDIAYNSIRAGATLITIRITDSAEANVIRIIISDNGCGMTEETVKKLSDPFYTTRTTRKVGLGIPLFKQNAELTGGNINIKSVVGEGTIVDTVFVRDSIDTPVMGKLADTMITLIQADENIDYVFEYNTDDRKFAMDTREMKNILGDVSINEPDVLLWIKDYIMEGIHL